MSKTKKLIGLWIELVLLFVLFLTFYLLSQLLDRLLGFALPRQDMLAAFLGAIAAIVGAYWVLWAYSYLHFVGKGSPIEAFGWALYPTQRLIETGPYAYTRNPVLFGLLFVLLGIAFFMESISGVILVPIAAVVALFYIRRFEEPELERRFGPEYVQYKGGFHCSFPVSDHGSRSTSLST